jgi:hypothetical protein
VIDVGKHDLAPEGIARMLVEGKSCHHRPGHGDMLALSARMNAEDDAVRRARESLPAGRYDPGWGKSARDTTPLA